MLIGNKSDIPEREISKEEAMKYAQEKGMLYFETSAKQGTNVEEAFLALTAKVHERHKKNKERPQEEE